MLPPHVEKEEPNIWGIIIRGPKYQLLNLIIQGKIEGNRWIGRITLGSVLDVELFRTASDRERFQQIVNMVTANV